MRDPLRVRDPPSIGTPRRNIWRGAKTVRIGSFFCFPDTQARDFMVLTIVGPGKIPGNKRKFSLPGIWGQLQESWAYWAGALPADVPAPGWVWLPGAPAPPLPAGSPGVGSGVSDGAGLSAPAGVVGSALGAGSPVGVGVAAGCSVGSTVGAVAGSVGAVLGSTAGPPGLGSVGGVSLL